MPNQTKPTNRYVKINTIKQNLKNIMSSLEKYDVCIFIFITVCTFVTMAFLHFVKALVWMTTTGAFCWKHSYYDDSFQAKSQGTMLFAFLPYLLWNDACEYNNFYFQLVCCMLFIVLIFVLSIFYNTLLSRQHPFDYIV